MNRLGDTPEFDGQSESPDSTTQIEQINNNTSFKQKQRLARIADLEGRGTGETLAPVPKQDDSFYESSIAAPLRDAAAVALGGAGNLVDTVIGGAALVDNDLAHGIESFREDVQGSIKEATGFTPFTRDDINKLYSKITQEQRKDLGSEDDFFKTLAKAPSNPLAIASHIGESLPTLAASAVMVPALEAIGLAGAAPAVAEGLVMTMAQAANIRGQKADKNLDSKDRVLSGITGLLGGATSRFGQKVSDKVGAINPESILSGKISKAVDSVGASTLKSGLVEGSEEGIQTLIESVLSNAALNKPLLDGVENSVAQGILAGSGTGIGTGFLFSEKSNPIDPATGEEFTNKKVSTLAKKYSNINKLKKTAKTKDVDTSTHDSNLDSVRDSLKDLKTENSSDDINKEVDSVISRMDADRSFRQVEKAVRGKVEKELKLSDRFQLEGFSKKEADVLSSNMTERFANTEDKETFLNESNFENNVVSEIARIDENTFKELETVPNSDITPEILESLQVNPDDGFNTLEDNAEITGDRDLLAQMISENDAEVSSGDVPANSGITPEILESLQVNPDDEVVIEEINQTLPDNKIPDVGVDLIAEEASINEDDRTGIEPSESIVSKVEPDAITHSDDNIISESKPKRKTVSEIIDEADRDLALKKERELKGLRGDPTPVLNMSSKSSNVNKARFHVDSPNGSLNDYNNKISELLKLLGTSDKIDSEIQELTTDSLRELVTNPLIKLANKKRVNSIDYLDAVDNITSARRIISKKIKEVKTGVPEAITLTGEERVKESRKEDSIYTKEELIEAHLVASSKLAGVQKIIFSPEDKIKANLLKEESRDLAKQIKSADSIRSTLSDNDTKELNKLIASASDKIAENEASFDAIRDSYRTTPTETTDSSVVSLMETTDPSITNKTVNIRASEAADKISREVEPISEPDPVLDVSISDIHNQIEALDEEYISASDPLIGDPKEAASIRKKLKLLQSEVNSVRKANFSETKSIDRDTLYVDEDTPTIETASLSESEVNVKGADVDYSYIGESAAKSLGENVSFMEAMDLAFKGKITKEELFFRTGWHYSRNQWVFEIDDSAMKILPGYNTLKDIPSSKGNMSIGNLGDVISHPQLFKAYPGLKDVKIVKRDKINYRGKFSPATSKTKAVLTVNSRLKKEPLKDVILHEIQHYIQTVEGLSKGGNPKMFNKKSVKQYLVGLKHNTENSIVDSNNTEDITNLKESLIEINNDINKLSLNPFRADSEIVEKIQMEMYTALLGEVQARDTANRRIMGPAARSLNFPGTLEGIPPANLVFNDDEGISFASDEAISFSKQQENEARATNHYKDSKVAVDHIFERVAKRKTSAIIDGITTKLSINLVKTSSELPSKYRNSKDDVAGVYDKKTNSIFIVSDKHDSTESVVKTVAHELVGHLGLKSLLGENYNNMLDRLLISDSQTLNDILLNVNRWGQYLDDWNEVNDISDLDKADIFKTKDKNGKEVLIPREVAIRLADEYIAVIAEENVFYTDLIRKKVGTRKSVRQTLAKKRESLLKRVTAKVSHMLRGVFGSYSDKISKDDILEMIAASANHVFKDTKFDYTKLIGSKDSADFDLSVRASILAKQAAIDMGAEVQQTSDMVKMMLTNDFGKVNESAHILRMNRYGEAIRNNPVLSKFFSMGALNHAKHLNAIESMYSGKLSDLKDFSRAFSKATAKVDKRNSDNTSDIFLFFTTKDAEVPEQRLLSDPAKDAKYKESMIKAKELISKLGENLVGLGLLDENTFLENDGSYLQTRYVKYLLASQGGKMKVSFQDYLKRKDPTFSDADRAMKGQIKDPGFLVSEAISKMGRDVALIQMYNSIYKSSEDSSLRWILGSSDRIPTGEKRGGKEVTLSIVELEKQIEEYTDLVRIHEDASRKSALNFSVEDYTKIKNKLSHRLSMLEDFNETVDSEVSDMLQSQTGKEASQEEIDRFKDKRYKRMPKSNRYGALSDKLVRSEIFDSFFEIDSAFAEANNVRYDGKLNRLHAWFKISKVAFNPPSHIRNGFTNAMLLDLSTNTNAGTLTKYIYESAEDIIFDKGSRWGKYAKIAGLGGTTLSAQELQLAQLKYHDKIKASETRDGIAGKGLQSYFILKEGLHSLVDLTGRVFGLNELVFKTSALRDYITIWEKQNLGRGKTIDSLAVDQKNAVLGEASAHANKALFDYSKVNRAVAGLRRNIVGPPFLTFMYKTFPVVVESAAKRPHKMARYIALPYLLGLLTQADNDWDDEEFKQFKADQAMYGRDSSSTLLLPAKSSNGHVQSVNLDYTVPWAPYFNAYLSAKNHGNFSSFSETVASTGEIANNLSYDTFGFLGGPVPQLATALLANRDPFTKKPVITEGAPGSQKVMEGIMHMANMALPTFLTGNGVFSKMYKALNHEKGFNLEDDKVTIGQAALSGVGFNVRDADPIAGRSINESIFSKKIRSAKKAYRQAINKGIRKGYSDIEIANLDKMYNTRFKYLTEKYNKILNP